MRLRALGVESEGVGKCHALDQSYGVLGGMREVASSQQEFL